MHDLKQEGDHPEKLIITIVKALQPVTDDDIYLEYNELREEELTLKDIQDRLQRLQRMRQVEKIGETRINHATHSIWQLMEH